MKHWQHISACSVTAFILSMTGICKAASYSYKELLSILHRISKMSFHQKSCSPLNMLLLLFFFTSSIYTTVFAREIKSKTIHKKTSCCCLSFFKPQFLFCKQEAQSNQFQSGFSALDLNPFMNSSKNMHQNFREGGKRTLDIVVFSDEQTDVLPRGIYMLTLLANWQPNPIWTQDLKLLLKS